jgi:hypothetical protein
MVSQRWHAPLDPECPEMIEYHERLWGDPMTAYSGVGDEIAEGWNRRHRLNCKRCQEYGVANIEVR